MKQSILKVEERLINYSQNLITLIKVIPLNLHPSFAALLGLAHKRLLSMRS